MSSDENSDIINRILCPIKRVDTSLCCQKRSIWISLGSLGECQWHTIFKELPIGNEGKLRFQNDLPTLDGDISATRKDFSNFQKFVFSKNFNLDAGFDRFGKQV